MQSAMADSLPLQSPLRDPACPPWLRRLTGPAAAAAILVVFWVAMLASLWNKSLTVDENGHLMAGYTYWKYNDYRLDPENGNLPQRLLALPLVLGNFQPP